MDDEIVNNDKPTIEERMTDLEFGLECVSDNTRSVRRQIQIIADIATALFVGLVIGATVFGNKK